MRCIFAAGVLNFSVCVFSLEISRGCTYIGGGRGGLKRKWGELNFKQVAPIAHRIDRLLMCGGDFSPPTTAIVSLQQGISCVHLMYFPRFARVFSRSAVGDFPSFLAEFSRLATTYFVISCGHSVCSQYLGASKTALLFGFAV